MRSANAGSANTPRPRSKFLSFHIPFLTEKVPLSYTFHIPSLKLCIPFKQERFSPVLNELYCVLNTNKSPNHQILFNFSQP